MTTSRKDRLVLCDGCTLCCQGDAVFLHPECGDDPRRYRTEPAGERLMLAHKANGDCIYLQRRSGCTIWDRRPTVCREMDCRVFLDPELLAALPVSRHRRRKISQAARRLAAREVRRMADRAAPIGGIERTNQGD